MDNFIASHYRRAFEDWPPDGAYRYLWTDIKEKVSSCPALPPASPSMLPGAMEGADSDSLAKQVKMLQEEVAELREELSKTPPKANNGNCASNASKKGCLKKQGCAWNKYSNKCGEAGTTSGQSALTKEATAAEEMTGNSGTAKAMAAWAFMSAMMWFM